MAKSQHNTNQTPMFDRERTRERPIKVRDCRSREAANRGRNNKRLRLRDNKQQDHNRNEVEYELDSDVQPGEGEESVIQGASLWGRGKM